MIDQILVIAASHSQFTRFISCLGVQPRYFKYVTDMHALRGIAPGREQPIFMLEGYMYNQDITISDLYELNMLVVQGKIDPLFVTKGTFL